MLQQLLLSKHFFGALLVSIFVFPYLVLRVVRERYLKETNVKKKPSDPNTSRQNTINSVRGSGGGGVLMARNLLKKNIIKALIGSSVKGI